MSRRPRRLRDMTRIMYTGGYYDTTQDDELWLARAVQAEGQVRNQVARALVNLFAFLRSRKGGSARTLEGVIRSYAQPVNPRWYPDGDLLQLSLVAKEGLAREEALNRAVRRRDEHSECTSFSEATYDAVSSALTSSWVSDVTDYAAPTLDATRKGYLPRSEIRAGENRLWTRAPGWPGYAVETARREDGGTEVMVCLLLLASAVALSRKG